LDFHTLILSLFPTLFNLFNGRVYISNRFDSTTFKATHADLYQQFTKPVETKRFSIN
jgi:hypothetical protein